MRPHLHGDESTCSWVYVLRAVARQVAADWIMRHVVCVSLTEYTRQAMERGFITTGLRRLSCCEA